MNRQFHWMGIALVFAACSSGGSGSPDSGATGSGGAVSGSGGSSPSGSGGSSPTGSGGSSPTGSGGAVMGTGGAGGPDASGSGGMMGTGGAVMPGTGQSVTQRGGDAAKTGHFIRPMLTKAKAATMATDAAFNATYAGSITGTPLYLENGPGGKGAFYVATNSNNIYGFDETTGAQIWMKNAGGTGQGGCDNQGKGALSAPAIDPATRLLLVAAANAGMQFKVHAYDVDTGAEKTTGGWPVNLNAAVGNADLARTNQRGALLMVNGTLYVPFGGQVGDCQGARGRVVAVNVADPTKIGAWSTSDDGSAIWAPGGLASDGTGIFGITGNHFPNNTAPGTHADSEEVFRLTGLAQLARSNANIFFPGRWAAMDNGDLDFGACSPLVMDLPGATPAKLVAAPSKDGHIYFLDPTNLGGMGGEKFDLNMANEGMSLLKTTPASYVTSMGSYVVVSTQGARGCPAGGANGTVMMGVRVTSTAGAVKATVAWCSGVSGDTSAVATTTDGKTDAVVWYVSGGVLKGVDGDTGAMVFSGGACSVQRWTSPIVAKGARIVAGGNGKLCSWSAM